MASARQAGDIAALGPAESALRVGLGSLFAVAEAYPDLKANETFQHVQTRISQLENAIADRREFYNATVNNSNIRIEQFPDVIVAPQLGFKEADLLVFDEKEQARKAAEAQVEQDVAKAAMKPEVSVLMKSEEDHPFILSTKSQDELTAAYRWKAIGGLALFPIAGVALAVTLTARFGGWR